ncbi:MAG TPA: ABC transporter, partial [Isosphaeraceae bacterium]|nr:ABC transporter [Isosphaeraceae bacterium]
MDARSDVWSSIPESRRDEVSRRLEPDEQLLAAFEPDLETTLRYARGLVLLTDRRILSGRAADSDDALSELQWESYSLDEATDLKAAERAGLGQIDLLGPSGRLDHWRYTAARSRAAQQLAERFASYRQDGSLDSARASTVCPSCGAVVSGDLAECPACSSPPPSDQTKTALLRLARFARARGGAIALGFFLTVASTAASLVPPYLTQPLV